MNFFERLASLAVFNRPHHLKTAWRLAFCVSLTQDVVAIFPAVSNNRTPPPSDTAMLAQFQQRRRVSMERQTAKTDMSPSSQESLMRMVILQQQEANRRLGSMGGNPQGSSALGLPSLSGYAMPLVPSLELSREQLLRSLIAAEQQEMQQRRLLALHHEQQLALQRGLAPARDALLLGNLPNTGLSASLNRDQGSTARSQAVMDQIAREYPSTNKAESASESKNPKKRAFEEVHKDAVKSESPKSATNAATPSPSSLDQSRPSNPPPKKRLSKVVVPKKPPAAAERKKDTKWLLMLAELKNYKDEYGNCIVPRGYAPNPRLASWVAEQRKQYKLMTDGKPSSITPERIAKLEELDFAWNAQEAAWKRHIDNLIAFKKEHGHCHVPLVHRNYPKLGLWVKEQRRHYALLQEGKPSHMTEARAKELNDLGFCWDTHEATWLDRLRQIKDYKKQYGDCLVPSHWGPNPKLGTWVNHQRRQYKKFLDGKSCHITQDRIDQLNEIGFHWYSRPSDTDASTVNSASSNIEDSSSSSDSESELGSLPPRKRHRFM